MNTLSKEMRKTIIEVLVNFIHNRQIFVTRLEFPDLFNRIQQIFPNEIMVSSYFEDYCFKSVPFQK